MRHTRIGTLILAAAALVGVSSGARAVTPLDAVQVAAGLTAATFTLFAIIAIVWGAGHLVVGAHIRRRRHWSRLVALLLASIDLLLVPYGTALGVYTLWVLLHEEAKRQFEVAVVATP